MEPLVNKELLALGALVEDGAKIDQTSVQWRDVRTKMVRWRGMNFVRATIVGIGALLTAVAAVLS